MKHKILICLDLLKYPNRGLGRVSLDFSQELVKSDGFDYTYLIPSCAQADLMKNQPIIELNNLRKLSSDFMKEFSVCHIIHQLPKFSYRKARKIVLTIHDLNFMYVKNDRKQKKYRHIVQSAVDKADAICFISNFTRDDCFNHLSISPDKITKVIYNGVGELPPSSEKPDWCPDSDFLFSIGQFLSKKNFHVLLPLMKQLPHISLVIAGENKTAYGQELRKLVHQYRLESQVILPGPVSETEKSFLYDRCNAFVFPSLAEGFGLPVIEAMKCGKPVFCSDKTSLREIGDRYAFFWEHFDPGYMSEVLTRGLNTFNCDSSIKTGQVRYANSFTWEKNVKDYIDIYKQLI